MRALQWCFLSLCVALFLWGCPSTPDQESSQETTGQDAASSDQGKAEKPLERAPVSANPLDGLSKIETLQEGFLFTEGPVWDATNQVVYFSDILTNQMYKLSLDAPDKREVFRKPSNFSNGLAFDIQGRLLAAERTTRRISVTKADGSIESLADAFEGKKFHGPNDITVHSQGDVYFTDPPYALPDSARELDFNGVFRISPKGDKVTAVWRGAKDTRPNGLILSPDEKRLYFADAANAIIWVAARKADGSLDAPKEFTKTSQTPDGMTMDAQENLYVAAKEGVEVYAKDGKKWGIIKVPQQPANCTFVGKDRKTLLITARGALYLHKNMPFAGVH